jgi:hypothetical protein
MSSNFNCSYMTMSRLTYMLGFPVKFFFQPLNVIFYQNMPNLHNPYKSAERNISQKNPKYMLTYFLPCSCSLIKDHIQIFSSETAEPSNTKPGRDGPWVGPFHNYVQQPRPPSKITAVTKNRNFFNCSLLLYCKISINRLKEKIHRKTRNIC